jgi:hypothetical protein
MPPTGVRRPIMTGRPICSSPTTTFFMSSSNAPGTGNRFFASKS